VLLCDNKTISSRKIAPSHQPQQLSPISLTRTEQEERLLIANVNAKSYKHQSERNR